ncbi:glutathione S-transferase [Oxalobacteraceae bacterium OM1]|nr:glutathione S-transferase [Oxalobacteraceae bacterium OM1]
MSQKPSSPIKFYGFPLSGHAHRVELFLSLLDLPFENIKVDLAKGEHRTPDFLALNALGQVPVIQDGDVTMADSNAILVYLATQYADESWLPRDPVGAAQVQRFLSIAAGEIAKGPGMARVAKLFRRPLDITAAQDIAARLFAMLEQHLASRPFLTDAGRTIADLACYTYIAHAPEGGISLDPYPNIRAWLARVEALPGFVGMLRSPLPAAE